jgi:hypothetical protein
MPEVAETKPLKFDLDGDVADDFRGVLDRKKIGYSEGAEALMRWFLRQESMLQSLILGQVDEEYTGQVASSVLTKMAGADGTKALSEATADMDHAQMAKAIRGLTDRLEVLCTAYKRDAERAMKKERGK